MKPILILVGPPGAGKGTQARVLAEKLGIPTISTGEIFRSEIEAETELGKLAASYINDGNLVPDEVTNQMVRNRLLQPDLEDGYFLDGYPRNIDQVHELDSILAEAGVKLSGVIELSIPDEEIVSRLLHRAEVENREDDTEPVIRHRIEVYHAKTAPLLELYLARGIVLSVDGTGTIEEVQERLAVELPAFLEKQLAE
ncbi:MAG: adenylate kinase [Arcanobacterium sp.]|nr:adenylate kinase [Arcanobacterium sp.]